MPDGRKKLEKRWSHTLTPFQRMAWDMCAVLATGLSDKSLPEKIDGKAFFIACNLKRMV